jgi:hypothetical protein
LNKEPEESDNVYPGESNSVLEIRNVKRETERERERMKCGSVTNDTHSAYGMGRENFTALKLHRQCPIVLSSMVRYR